MHLIIIGAGPGGYETALEAAVKGVNVTLVSDGPAGGTCLNEGCIPTKTLWKTASLLDELRSAAEFGVDIPQSDDGALSGGEGSASVVLNIAKAMERKDAVTAQLRSGIEFLLSKNKLIHYVQGRASFVAKDDVSAGVSVKVEQPSGESEIIVADKAIIATGSVSASLPVPGADLPGVINSTGMLCVDAVPQRLCIIGAGVIGLEFASIFNSFGSKVTVVEYCKDILPRFDTDLAKRLKQQLGKNGITIETGAAVQSIESLEDGSLSVNFMKKDKVCKVEADKVLMAVGRRPHVAGLNLEAAGVEYSPKGIVTDFRMLTSNPDIYAIGDVRGKMMLAHVATFEGRRALGDMLGSGDNIDFGIIPAAVFTIPEAASVGLSEDECNAAGRKTLCLKSQYRSNGKALSLGETEGWCKIVTDAESGEILGAHLFGAHASDLVHEIAALMKMHASVADLSDMIHAHPTLSEVLGAAN